MKKIRIIAISILISGINLTQVITKAQSAADSLSISTRSDQPITIQPETMADSLQTSFLQNNVLHNDNAKECRQNNKFFCTTYGRMVLPAVLISYGILAHNIRQIKDIDHSTKDEVNEHPKRNLAYDNYTQFAPVAGVYLFDLVGIKSKHSFRDRTILMATSYSIMAGSVAVMKSTTKVMRPDNTSPNSFPSGHTATAFTGAHILFREYCESSLWLSLSGYVFAATTGTLRVINDRHWVSDVVAGAGVGILSAEIGYLLLPPINKLLFPNSKNKKESISFAPSVQKQGISLGMVYVF